MNKEKLNAILYSVKAECEKKGMVVLPPLTEEQRIRKAEELASKFARKLSAKSNPLTQEQIAEMEARSVEMFYNKGNRTD